MFKCLLFLLAIGLCAVPAHAQVIPDSVYQKQGFEPYWKLGSEPQFDCVGRFDGAKSSGVWIGGPYVLFVVHGTGTQGKGVYSPSDPTRRVFVLQKNGKDYKYKGAKWHIPRAGWILDAGTSKAVSDLYTTVTTAIDFCVLELSETPHVAGIEPAKIYTGENEVGMEAVWVGYGIRGIASVGDDEKQFGWGGGDSPARKIAFYNLIDGVNRWGYMLWSRFDEKGLALEGHQSPGSSGGGVFVKIGTVWYLIGGADNGKGSLDDQLQKTGSVFGAISGATRISKWRKELMAGLSGDWSSFEAISTKRLNDLPLKSH